MLVNEVLDRVLIDDEFDFVTEIARELPISLLCKLLGVDQADAGKLVSWGDRMISNTDPEYTDFVIDKDNTDEYRLLPFRSPAALEVFSYAEQAALQRREDPQNDIISDLLAPDKDGNPLTDLEFKNFFSLLMVAGNETTRHTITHGLMMMMNHPDQWSAFRNDPSGMSKLATEEILRASSVTMHFRRTATVDTELGGKEIRAGDKVVMWYISADYDEDAFRDPFVFDITRDEGDVLAFGSRQTHLPRRSSRTTRGQGDVRGTGPPCGEIPNLGPARPFALQLHQRNQTPPCSRGARSRMRTLHLKVDSD